VRPPGHHATRDETMGFCFFNNVAVGARHALDVHGLERVAIIDFDVHHGNGTEDIIAGDDRVLMCSFFQHPLYPYSGAVPKGTNMINVPIAPYTRGPELRETIDDVDAAAGRVPPADGLHLGRLRRPPRRRPRPAGPGRGRLRVDHPPPGRLADRHAQGRIVSCLEGGYALSALARSVAAHLRVLADM
jgi:acetoin utilization deacetylase AcuC-like enzyme